MVAVAVALVAGGVVAWLLLGRGVQTTIPDSFDGEWQGMNADRQVLTATLDKGQELGSLASGANGCYNGALAVSKATSSRLTMRFTPVDPSECNTWTVVFTHLSGGGLSMTVDSDSNRYHETDFIIRMNRQGLSG